MNQQPEWQPFQDRWDTWRALCGILGAVGGVVLGGYIGLEIAPPTSLAVAGRWLVVGCFLGFIIGALVGLLVGWATPAAWERWHGRT